MLCDHMRIASIFLKCGQNVGKPGGARNALSIPPPAGSALDSGTREREVTCCTVRLSALTWESVYGAAPTRNVLKNWSWSILSHSLWDFLGGTCRRYCSLCQVVENREQRVS